MHNLNRKKMNKKTVSYDDNFNNNREREEQNDNCIEIKNKTRTV